MHLSTGDPDCIRRPGGRGCVLIPWDEGFIQANNPILPYCIVGVFLEELFEDLAESTRFDVKYVRFDSGATRDAQGCHSVMLPFDCTYRRNSMPDLFNLVYILMCRAIEGLQVRVRGDR